MTTEDLYTRPLLPQSTRELVADAEKPIVALERRHPGLQLDKLSTVGNMEAQKVALVKASQTLRDEPLLRSLLARRRTALDALGAQRLPMTTRGSLTLHLSRSGALENAGIALHPVYGFVYLPGSGIKGLVRAWAETVWAAAQPDKEAAWHRIEEAFGWSPQSENHKFPQPKKGLPGWRPREIQPQPGAAAGRLVFHDSWPLCWPRLILDVVNNHHRDYYDGEDDPGDWEEPNLIYFLAVGGNEQFEFAISDRKPEGDGLLDLACGWLRDALATEGAGAKTAAGYGRFKPDAGEAPAVPSPDFTKADFASARFDLKLVTPAFLAGASQKKNDCDLRPATLRGLLRWWWRTMHAAHLDRGMLKELETAVWGDAESGSPLGIAVDLAEDRAPVLYDHKDGFRPKPDFKRQHDLEDPPNRTTQGLFYASYGMDDGPKKGKHGMDDDPKKGKRWYRPAGACWSVTLTARTGQFNGVSLMPQQLLEQATAALWLLCCFGGVGSKGRKGFGSFEDIQGIASREQCQEFAQGFRETCRLSDRAGKRRSPALEGIKPLEVRTPWRDSWTALDQLGFTIQDFAQRYAHKEEKKALGLPRNIHGPRDRPMPHQNPATHKPPKKLSAKKGKRHAAPVLYHLARSDDGQLLIRVTAFPSHYLPDLGESQRMLSELLDFLDTELKRRVKSGLHIGQCRTGPQPSPQPPPGLPEAGQRVEAELLPEKTKKGGWKAKHLDSGISGPIHDNQNAPANAEAGQRVTLTVASANQKDIGFRWAEPQPPKKTPGRKGQRGPGGRGRR